MSFSFQFTLKQIVLGLFLTAAAGVLPLLMAQAAKAQSVTADLEVEATVKASCKINSVNDINFGTYDAFGTHYSTPLTATGKVTVSCLPKVTASIKLEEGTNPATGSTCAAPQRQMAGGSLASSRLPYGLYQDAAHTTVWGCAASSELEYTAAKPTAQDFTIYGRIPAFSSLSAAEQNEVTPGTYNDTVQIVVSF